MYKNLMLATGMLSLLATHSSANPSLNREDSVLQSLNQKNQGFIPPAAADKAGVFDFEKTHDYKIDHGPNKGKVAPIYGLRIRIEEDNAEQVKKMVALPKKEMDAIDMLPKKEKKKKIAEWYENFYKQLRENPKLVDVMYKQLESGSRIFYSEKNLCDPKCFDGDLEGGFITGFYTPGANQTIDPIVLIHGGPGGDAVSMLDVAANLSAATGRSVLAYTQRGCAGSGVSFDRAKDSFDQSSQDLGKVIDATRALSKRDQVVLCGHSFGPIIQSCYLSNNDSNKKVSSSIYIAPGPMDLEGRIASIVKRKELSAKFENKINKEKDPRLKHFMYHNIKSTQFYDWDKAKNYAQDLFKSDSRTLLETKNDNYQDSKNLGYENNWNLESDLIKKLRKDKSFEQCLKKNTVPT
jgi:pimeloyl-ACP methyl ester carboxylesterase